MYRQFLCNLHTAHLSTTIRDFSCFQAGYFPTRTVLTPAKMERSFVLEMPRQDRLGSAYISNKNKLSTFETPDPSITCFSSSACDSPLTPLSHPNQNSFRKASHSCGRDQTQIRQISHPPPRLLIVLCHESRPPATVATVPASNHTAGDPPPRRLIAGSSQRELEREPNDRV